MQIASDFVDKFVTPLDSFMTGGISNLTSAIEGPLIIGATLYIVIFGILIVLGYVRAPISDFVVNVIKIVILVALCTNVDTYNTYVKDFFFNNLPDGITAAIGQVSGTGTSVSEVSTGAVFDSVLTDIIALSNETYRQWTWEDWYPLLVTALVLFGLVPIGALLAVVLLAKVGLTLMLVLGPIFIAFYLFNATSSFTSSWISGLVTFVVLQVLAITFITLLMSIFADFVNQARSVDGAEQLNAALALVFTFVLALILAALLPQIAAQLAGSGIRAGGGLIHQGVNTSRSIANRAGGGAGRSAIAGMRWGYNKVANRSGGSITQG